MLISKSTDPGERSPLVVTAPVLTAPVLTLK